jgi:AcrR family transcriptional regulator
MAKASDSKGKTLAAAARLFRQQGYQGTALHDILAAGGSPRGSLYFHFPGGKEEIGEAALTLAGEAVRQAIAHAAETSESAEVFLTRIARGMASDLEKSNFSEGCPIATTALETAAQSEVLGAATFKNGKAKSNAGCSASVWSLTRLICSPRWCSASSKARCCLREPIAALLRCTAPSRR